MRGGRRIIAALSATINCAICGCAAPRTGVRQLYCEKCSAERHAERQRKWARQNPLSSERSRTVNAQRIKAIKVRGRNVSAIEARPIAWGPNENPPLEWLVRIAVPFAWSASKNSIYTMRAGGHVALRREAKAYRTHIAALLKAAVSGRKIANNKLWLDILVQKPNHKGDAVNFVDTICDAVKDAIGLDDRWYSIYRLDWQIVKHDPKIFIGIGQVDSEDVRICSHCGRALTFSYFNRNRSMEHGIGRTCRDCSRAVGRADKRARLSRREPRGCVVTIERAG